jgi:hypothetical protein
MITSGCLWYGVKHDKYLIIMPWLIFAMIRLLIATLGLFIGFILLFSVYKEWGLGYGLILVGLGAPIVGFGYYVWIRVLSVYSEIKESEGPSQPITA